MISVGKTISYFNNPFTKKRPCHHLSCYVREVNGQLNLPIDAMPNGTATLMPRRTVAITAMTDKHEDDVILVMDQYIDYLDISCRYRYVAIVSHYQIKLRYMKKVFKAKYYYGKFRRLLLKSEKKKHHRKLLDEWIM